MALLHTDVDKFLNGESTQHSHRDDELKETDIDDSDECLTKQTESKIDIPPDCQTEESQTMSLEGDSLEDTPLLEGTTEDALSEARMETTDSPSSCSVPSASPPAYPAESASVSPEQLVQLVPSGEEVSLYKDCTPVTHAITSISSVEVKTVDTLSTETAQYSDTSDSGSSDQPKTNGVTKRISKALNEKILKKLNQQTMVNNVNNCAMAVSSASCMNGYVQDPQSNIHVGNNLPLYPVKSEILQDYSHMNGNVSPVDDTSMSILPLETAIATSVMTDHMAQSAPSSVLCDTISGLQMPVNTSALQHQQQPGQYTYSPGVQPVQIIHNVHTTYQSNINTNSAHNVTPVRQNSYPPSYPSTNGYMYPALSSPPSEGQTPERDSMLERYIQQQQYFHENQQLYPYAVKDNQNYAMKSPDSGYQEPCLSPNNVKAMAYKDGNSNYHEGAANGNTTGQKRRRKSATTTSYPAKGCTFWPGNEKVNYSTTIPKLDLNTSGYKYIMETPISTSVRMEEDRITYLNKGQYYGLTLEFNADRIPQCQFAKSVIMVVFRDDKSLEDERKAWEFWHSRQHSYKQRVLDIDTKDSQGVLPSSITEVAFNAVAVKWNPRDSPVKVNIAVHCLSTDFSNQKGVKGFPLHVQIDTFENHKDPYPVHRGYCQIKVFCDKGAERKTRDEDRRRTNRAKSDVSHSSRKRNEQEVYWPPCERSEFYSMAETQTFPVLFTPATDQEESTKSSPVNGILQDDDGNSSLNSNGDCLDESMYPMAKRQRRDSFGQYADYPKILLYVREQHETVFTALMLRTPTLQGLLQSVQEKYSVAASKVKSTYKRSKKGILVRMDDNIVRHYSHESTFMIEINEVNEDKDYEVILTEIDPN
ncbi:grainyhead-like protein 2 homolog isoform X4 [Pecten maximus]|nr:grainyhead-like protein 2 homolog isoform X4 [Pecten maximus]